MKLTSRLSVCVLFALLLGLSRGTASAQIRPRAGIGGEDEALQGGKVAFADGSPAKNQPTKGQFQAKGTYEATNDWKPSRITLVYAAGGQTYQRGVEPGNVAVNGSGTWDITIQNIPPSESGSAWVIFEVSKDGQPNRIFATPIVTGITTTGDPAAPIIAVIGWKPAPPPVNPSATNGVVTATVSWSTAGGSTVVQNPPGLRVSAWPVSGGRVFDQGMVPTGMSGNEEFNVPVLPRGVDFNVVPTLAATQGTTAQVLIAPVRTVTVPR